MIFGKKMQKSFLNLHINLKLKQYYKSGVKKGLILIYKIIETSKKNGDPKRFSCDIFIKD